MISRVLVRPEADADIRDAHSWYEQQIEGLGDEFLSCLDACVTSICRSPQIYPQVHGELRRALVRRFPYGVFYLVEDDAIVIVAVFHVRRNPAGWYERV